jgi:hypothetical protein
MRGDLLEAARDILISDDFNAIDSTELDLPIDGTMQIFQWECLSREL